MEQISRKAVIGVLGGMGPLATIDFMTKIVQATPAKVDQEHIPLIVYDVPQIPDRTQAIRDHSDAPFPILLKGLRTLEQAGADYIAIPCNTAHFWYDRLAEAGRVPIIHIADAARRSIQERAAGGRIALLGTRGTIGTPIYQKRLSDAAIDLFVPEEATQTLVDAAIAAVKANELDRARETADAVAERLLGTGTDVLLLACTELPLAFAKSREAARALDATAALARACVAASLGTATP